MIRPSKKKSDKDKISLQELQQNVVEMEKCKKNPIYFYNTYIRKDGQPVLGKEEYDKLMKEWEDARTQTFKEQMNTIDTMTGNVEGLTDFTIKSVH